MFEQIDTGKSSILHRLFPSSPEEPASTFRHFIIPYAVTVLATYGILSFLFIVSERPLTLRSLKDIGLLMLEVNIIWILLISLPVFIIFILTERRLIPSGIHSLKESGVLSIPDEAADQFGAIWQKRYRTSNVVGQLIGTAVGLSVSIQGYMNMFDIFGFVDLTTWYVLLCAFFFYFALSILIVRSFTTAVFLGDLVKNADIQIIPFHPDQCGGLGAVGVFGLRNQYVLSLIGFRVVLEFLRNQSPISQNLFNLFLAAYSIFGWVGFLGPLLPFRNAMRKEKTRLMNLAADPFKEDYRRAILQLREGRITKADQELLARHESLGKLIGKLPEWPFNWKTFTKFLIAYLLPFILILIDRLLPDLIPTVFP